MSDERAPQAEHPDQRCERLAAQQPHAVIAPAADLAQVSVQNLSLPSRPALALRPQRGQARGHLHADHGAWLVRRLPAGDQQPPGEVDVLGGHPPVVAADGHHPVAVEHGEHSGNDADTAGERLGAPDQADDRRSFEHLHRADQTIGIGDMGAAGHGRQHRRGLDPRHEIPDCVGVHVSVGVSDDHQPMPGPRESDVELLGLAAVDRVTQHAAASVSRPPPGSPSPRCRRWSRHRGPTLRAAGSRTSNAARTLVAITASSL